MNGSLLMSHCCLEGNFAQNDGGAISAEDGSRICLVNCTVSGNDVYDNGGAIAMHGIVEASFAHCTIVENGTTDPTYTGGLALGANVIEVYSSIIADNTKSGGLDSFDSDGPLPGHVVSLGYNLTDINAPNAFDAPGDLTGTDPELNALSDSGGWSKTHAPGIGSR